MTMKKYLAAFAATGGILAGGIAFASPAAAVSSCGENSGSVDIAFPGKKPQSLYSFMNCADVSNGKVSAWTWTTWQMMVDVAEDPGKRFTSFKVTTRLEKREWGGVDTVVSSTTCDLTRMVNENLGWAALEKENKCLAPSATYDKNMWWSSDSTVSYDIEGDGKGVITKQLTGSPLLFG
ncbi:hypothetical protein ACFCXT_22780 [Streptomyces vinaceus]|uniref:hypothetical protein n=1 Tax=Streptomyces vinaceus TaxID=1960 RepID=UPI0035DD605C